MALVIPGVDSNSGYLSVLVCFALPCVFHLQWLCLKVFSVSSLVFPLVVAHRNPHATNLPLYPQNNQSMPIKSDSRQDRAEEAERRRKLEGNTLFSDLGEPIQKLLMQVAKDITDAELKSFSKVTVRQLAKVFDMLAVEEDPDKILAWLKREMNKNSAGGVVTQQHRNTVKTGAARDAVKFYQELEKKNMELMEKMKDSAQEREQKRSANIAERKKRREQAQKEAAEAREREEKTGVKTNAVDKLKKTDLADIVGTFDRFTSKASTYDNSGANQDTEWWKQEDFRRDFEKNGRKGKLWTRVIAGGSQGAPDSEIAVREEWFRSQCWWKSDKYKRDWLASRDAEWWKEETYIRDWQDNGDKGAMWTAADELSGFNRKGDRRRAAQAELDRRVQWYQNNGPKGVVKLWCGLTEGSKDRCTLEEKREREDFFKNGDWWKNDEFAMKGSSKKPTAGDPIFVAGAAGQDREWWKDESYRQDFLKGGNTWKAVSEKAAVLGQDVPTSEAEAKKREEWYSDYWWKAQKYVDDFKKNGANGKLWRARAEEETANASPKACKESEAKLREQWYKTADDREWWKDESYIRDWQENGNNGKKWTAGWQDAGISATGDVDKAKAEEIAKRENWFKNNWWKADKYVKDFQANGTKGTAWKVASKETHSDSDWWKEGDYIKQWSATKKVDVTPFWQQPKMIEDYWKKGGDGKKWIAADAAAASVDKGAVVQATPEELAAREAFYQENWWKSPECQRDYAANGRDGRKWAAVDANGTGKANAKELKAREAWFESAHNPSYNGMFEADGVKHNVMKPAAAQEIINREDYYQKNWWKRPEVKADYKLNGENSKLLKAATAEAAALDLGGDPEYQASPEDIAARKQWFESDAKDGEWWQGEEYAREFAANREPEFWKNPEVIEDYVKNGAAGKKWCAANAAAASTGKGDVIKATPGELKDREEWLKKNFWKSKSAREDFLANGEKGTIWSTSEANGKGQTVSDAELAARTAHFRPNLSYQSADEPKDQKNKFSNCGAAEALDREEWFEKNWWKSPEVEADYRKHGAESKLLKAATHEVAALGKSDDPQYQACADEIKERMQYFETVDDRDWWKDPAVIADYQKYGKEGAQWKSRSQKEAAMSQGLENPATPDELAEREQWFETNFWKNPNAVEDYQANGNKGTIWTAASFDAEGKPQGRASDADIQKREQWFEAHRTVSSAELESRKEWFQRQLTDEEKIARRDWVVKTKEESKKISTDELGDVLTGLNDGQAPSQEQLKMIEDAVKRRRAELYGEENDEDPDAITQEEFVTAVAETNFYVPQTEEERLRAEEEALEAMQAEELMRLQEEAEFLKLEAEEERAAAGEDYVDEAAIEDEEAAYLDQMEADNQLEAKPNEDDIQYTEEDEAAWQDFLEKQGEDGDLTEDQVAELQRQEEERLAAEAAREAADAAAWQSEEYVGEGEGEEDAVEADEAGLAEGDKEELEALVQEEGEGWEGEEEEWEEGAGEEAAEEVDELAMEEKGQPLQWKLPLRQVTNPQFLKSYFTVIKYTPSHAFLGGKQKRIWVVDHFTRCFYNLDKSGKIKKEHAANKLLQLERNILDSSRLRLMFFDASHSYELQFQTPEERERFYETASAIRPSIRVYAPDLTNSDASVEACTTTIDGVGPEAVTVTCSNAAGKPVARELTGECKVNASKLLTEPLTIWTGTFNLSGHHPPRNPAELGQWMPKDKYDIYAVAVQEASYRKEESEWFEFIQSYLGKDYLSLASMNLWDTLLIVLCRKKHLLKITNVEGSTKATIHKSVCGTKGGIGISLRYLETSICFVTCHLAARLERNAMRNTNLEEIFDCLQLGIRETDFANQFNHVFFFGDFNYRVELDSAPAEKLIADKNYSQLLDYDQMSNQRRDEGIIHGFQEPPITFAPTYRMQVGSDKYMAERGNAPSYCDRVLTRSMANTWVKCTSYKSHSGVQTSEHSPVSATFIIRCVRPVMSCFAQTQSPIPMIVFEEINFVESTGPIIKKPAILISSPFTKIVKHVEAKTTQTATPFWEGSQLPKLTAVTQVQEYLETCHIILILREAAEKREDKMHRGTGLITLFGRVMGVQDVQQEFESDVLCHGRCIGKLVGKFHWEPAPLTA